MENKYKIELTDTQLSQLQDIIEYVTSKEEFSDFVEQLYIDVEGIDEDDWEKWKSASDVPEDTLKEFDDNSGHVYLSGYRTAVTFRELFTQQHENRSK
jgi:hypothetical protein